MKVTLITDSDVFAGTERHILDLAKALSDKDVLISVTCPSVGSLGQRVREANIPLIDVPKGRFDVVIAAMKLGSLLRKNKLDVLHTHNGRSTFAAVLACLWAGRGKVVQTQHFISPSRTTATGWKRLLKEKFHSWLSRRVFRIIAISEAVAQGIKSRNEATSDTIAVVWNGIVDPSQHNQSLNCTPELTSLSGIKTILCPARLEREKGHDQLIDALSLLHLKNQEWMCYFLGEGSDRARLEDKVQHVGLSDKVTFLGFRDNVFGLMAESDLIVLPAADEPFGLVLIEAMALAKPVVAMASGGPLEIIKSGQTGLLVPVGNASLLGDALAQLLADDDLRITMGAQGRISYVKCFTAERMATQTHMVYNSA